MNAGGRNFAPVLRCQDGGSPCAQGCDGSWLTQFIDEVVHPLNSPWLASNEARHSPRDGSLKSKWALEAGINGPSDTNHSQRQ